MRLSRVVRASESQCSSRNCPGFDPSILRHSGIWRAADETVLNTVHKKTQEPPLMWCCTWRNVTCSSMRTSLDRLVENWRRENETHKRSITFSTSEISRKCEKSRGIPQFRHCCVFFSYTVKRQICARSVFISFLETCVETVLPLGSSTVSVFAWFERHLCTQNYSHDIKLRKKGQLSILYSTSKKLKKRSGSTNKER
jgi:hypothetical protein